jgi:hypothetical protein
MAYPNGSSLFTWSYLRSEYVQITLPNSFYGNPAGLAMDEATMRVACADGGGRGGGGGGGGGGGIASGTGSREDC